MIGQTIAHYRVTAKLGAGGMGEVYRATDTKLGRDVALKVLPAEMARDPERLARFQREARAVAALNHPHIVTVFSVEEAGGVHFLTMELVEGQSLDHRIPEGGLPVEQIVEIASALAEALAAAHEKGIVHRDLKPANVMVTDDGRVKVLDFGLAKETRPANPTDATVTSAGHTEAGVVMGTPTYMSPEQVAGRAVDHRTDIFSLGIMLYEMVTGRRPFQGHSSAELVSSILRDTPPVVTEVRLDLPSDLVRIIRRCLEKDPRHRVQTARDVGNEFRDLARQGSQKASAPTSRAVAAADSGAARADEGFWVAVLPFKSSGDAEMESFADGLGEEITTGLSRFRYLSVVASASAARLKGKAGDERTLGAKLGARYVLEGSIRKGGSAIRVSAQLIDAQAGARLWAETYNRDLQTSSIFAVQDDVAARIVATVADSYGVLVHSIRSAIRQKDDVDLTPVEWQFQYFAYREQITPAAHAALKSRLERVVERDDRQSDLWACLAQIYVDEYAFGFRGDATSLDRALAAARRAVEFDRANQFALVSLAQVHFFRRDLAAFGPAAERAMALNPLNTDALGILGLQIVHTGEFERGTAIVRRAMELNANHAGWMHFAPLWEHFHKGEYEQALECANRVDVPGLFWPYLVVAAACGHLGRRAEAEAAVRDLLALDPEFAAHARSNIESWHFASGLLEPVLEGLRKAGLSIPATDGSSDSPRRNGTVTAKADRAESGTDSGQVRAEEGFWVAVLPFKYGGANADLTALAEGLSEEIVTGLSRFSYLRVIARTSTSRHAHEAVDVRTAGKELGARYVMEGSLRQAGSTLRIAVQLVDASTGAHLWAETYDRAFHPEAVFELQDEVVPRIVSTVADMYGVLPRSMSEALRGKADEELSPHEAVLRAFGYMERVTPEEHARVRRILERAVSIAPNQSDAWAMLANLYWEEHAHGFNPQPDPLGRALAAARRAVEAAPSNNLAHYALACTLFFQKDFLAFRSAAERTIELNRMDASVAAFIGNLIAYAGDWERGSAVVESAMQLNPHHPGWYWFANFNDAYRQRDYRGALGFALKINTPGNFYTHAVTAAAYGQLGMREAARKALQELLAIRPDFANTAREEFGRWLDLEFVEHLIDGLRKAGLEIAPKSGTAASAPAATTANVGTISGSLARPAIAVLPFHNLSGDPEQEYFADGITEEIINALAHIPGLRVAGRSSAFSFKGRNEDLRSVGAKLGVATILEGTLRRSGDRLRITVQLIDAGSGYQLWSERYDRVMEDVFAVQDEIARTIAGRLQLSLAADRDSQPMQPPTRHIGAFELYLKGRGLLYQRGLSIPKAIDCFTQAVALDPAYAQAWAGLADGYTTSGYSGFKPAAEVMPRALEAARRALQLDPDLAEAHSALACATLLYERNFELAEQEFRRALELNPSYPQARAWYGLFFLQWVAGREREARDELLRLLQLDPLSAYANVILSFSNLCSGRLSEAVDHARRGVELDPNSYLAHWCLASALQVNAQYEEAAAVAERALAISGRHSWALTTLVSIYAAWGKPDNARAVYREVEARSAREYVQPSMLAPAAAAVGDMDGAIAIAQRVLEDDKDPLFVMLARTWPGYDQLRTDSRFLEIVRQLALPGWNPTP